MRLVGTEACVREIRGVDRRGDTAKGMGAAAQYRRRTGGVSKGMGRAGSSKEKGRAEKEGGKGRRGQGEGTPLSQSTARSVGAHALLIAMVRG